VDEGAKAARQAYWKSFGEYLEQRHSAFHITDSVVSLLREVPNLKKNSRPIDPAAADEIAPA
jgi:hypothetical protein